MPSGCGRVLESGTNVHYPSDFARYVYRCAGDEKHLVCDERFAMNDIRFRFSQLFMDLQTIRITTFMYQAAQRDIKHLINDCVRT